MIAATDLKNALAQHYGSQTIFKHSINPRFFYTEGVQCFAEEAGAYWFLDIVATDIWEFCLSLDFASVVLAVGESGGAAIGVEDGDGGVLWRKGIAYTDCPEGEWIFFYQNSTLLLPLEY